MTGTTSVPTISFTDKGFVAPAESAIVTGLNADYNAAFGGGLNTAPATPQGQLIASTAAMLGDSNDQQVAVYNGVDPAFASGRMQDAIGRIYFLERNPAQSTVLTVTCGGLVGVVIPAGASVVDTGGERYLCTGAGVIPVSATIDLEFAAVDTGPLPVPGSVSIYQAIPGWNTAVVAGGVVGNVVESRAAFEARRQATVAANGAGFLPAIAGAVAKVTGVLDYYATENSTGSPVTIGGVSIAANSMYVCVYGGASADIAAAIFTKKNPGCGMVGSTSVTVTDTNSGYSVPKPTYTIKFQRPTLERVVFLVTITNSAAVPADAATQIQNAVYAAFLGNDGGARARIGSTIYASRFYGPVALLGPWVQLVSILIGDNVSPPASFTGVIAGTALSVSGVTGTIAIGQFVDGLNVAPGTRIVSGSGSSWVVSISQTVGSEAMTGIAAASNDVTMHIDQEPVMLGPPDCAVVLV